MRSYFRAALIIGVSVSLFSCASSRRYPERPASQLTQQQTETGYGGLLFGPLKDERGGSRKLFVPVRGKLSSRFGRRRGRPHNGIDIAAPKGTTIRAAESGRVLFSGWKRGYGRTVIIVHVGRGIRTLYAHCTRLKVSRGQRVRRGQVIGTVGRSGNATGNHLHFEVQSTKGIAMNPMPFFKGSRGRYRVSEAR